MLDSHKENRLVFLESRLDHVESMQASDNKLELFDLQIDVAADQNFFDDIDGIEVVVDRKEGNRYPIKNKEDQIVGYLEAELEHRTEGDHPVFSLEIEREGGGYVHNFSTLDEVKVELQAAMHANLLFSEIDERLSGRSEFIVDHDEITNGVFILHPHRNGPDLFATIHCDGKPGSFYVIDWVVDDDGSTEEETFGTANEAVQALLAYSKELPSE